RSAAQFELELQRMIDTHYNHPSIVMWVIFNEGWGQYDTARLANWLQNYDPTRLVNSVSGWNDVGAGHVYDIHRYPGPESPEADAPHAPVLGECGGWGLPIASHTSLDRDNSGYRPYPHRHLLFEPYTALCGPLRELRETQGLAPAISTPTTDVQ